MPYDRNTGEYLPNNEREERVSYPLTEMACGCKRAVRFDPSSQAFLDYCQALRQRMCRRCQRRLGVDSYAQ